MSSRDVDPLFNSREHVLLHTLCKTSTGGLICELQYHDSPVSQL